MNEDKNLEVSTEEVPETMPEAGGLVSIAQDGVQDIVKLADSMPILIDAFNRIRTAILKLAQPGDWVMFESKKNKTAKAEIGFAGANRIGTILGVNYTDWTVKKEVGTDERGAWYRWEYECNASYKGRQIRVYGRAGTRDKFFGREDGADKKLENIKEDDIKIAAMRAAKKEGVRDLFGLHHMDPEYLKKQGVSLESAGGYAFKSNDDKAAEIEVATCYVEEITMKKFKDGKVIKYVIKGSEGEAFETFSESFAKKAKEFKEMKKQVQIHFKKTQYGLDVTAIEAAAEAVAR